MKTVEKIYGENKNRVLQKEDRRSRKPISLIHAIRKRSEQGELAVISEFKRRSPSGFINNSGLEVEDYVKKVISLGTDAISILTEPDYFGGSYEDIIRVNAIPVPILMKDFVSTEDMVQSGYNSGADAVLLIADFLPVDTLTKLTGAISGLGMESLVEFHSISSLDKIDRVINDKSVLIGYNRRDLNSLKMEKGCKYIPDAARTYPCILESGIGPETMRDLPLGSFDGVLIGESILNGLITPKSLRKVNA